MVITIGHHCIDGISLSKQDQGFLTGKGCFALVKRYLSSAFILLIAFW